MQKVFNKDGFNWWIGVVEDRDDPERLGRCRVRIFGLHSESKLLLPTKDLPWAVPIQPITSAALSGVGSSPLGPLPGTWVMGFFLDGEDCQQPAMLGTIASTNAGKGFAATPEKDLVSNKNDGVVKDEQGTPVVDSQGNPVRSGQPSTPGWSLGQTSETYESGGKGPGVINDYKGAAKGDYGGASYGTYQFASFLPAMNEATGKARPVYKGNSPVEAYLKDSKFRDRFKGLTPATPEFDAKWKEIASSETQAFKDDQHDFIQRKYYDVMCANLARKGMDLSKFGPGVQDLIWSTAVQFGPTCTSMFLTPLKDKAVLTDKDIITLVSEYKINTVNEYFAKSSESIRQGARNRFEREKKDLLALVKS